VDRVHAFYHRSRIVGSEFCGVPGGMLGPMPSCALPGRGGVEEGGGGGGGGGGVWGGVGGWLGGGGGWGGGGGGGLVTEPACCRVPLRIDDIMPEDTRGTRNHRTAALRHIHRQAFRPCGTRPPALRSGQDCHLATVARRRSVRAERLEARSRQQLPAGLFFLLPGGRRTWRTSGRGIMQALEWIHLGGYGGNRAALSKTALCRPTRLGLSLRRPSPDGIVAAPGAAPVGRTPPLRPGDGGAMFSVRPRRHGRGRPGLARAFARRLCCLGPRLSRHPSRRGWPPRDGRPSLKREWPLARQRDAPKGNS